jgi:hypothetical protein
MTPPETPAIKPEAKKVHAAPAQTRVDQARIDKWIRDRLVAAWPGGCWHCRRPIVVGQKFVDVRGSDGAVRFHAQCESEWRRAQEAAARRALNLIEPTTKTSTP